MSALSVALAHYRARQALSSAVVNAASRLWLQVDRGDIAGSWLRLMPRLLAALTVAQRAAAEQAPLYVAQVLREQGLPADAVALVPTALAGVASDGRDLDTLLMQPAITVKSALAQGAALERAMSSGLASLQMITSTQVADAGRVADGVVIASQRVETGYVRMLVGNSCARCVVLAGRRYHWNAGFDRHPHCDCVHVPYRENVPGDVTTDPDVYFRSLSRHEQDQAFGKDGAEAIRDGADIGQVVNARRGMYTAGGQSLTREGTSRRGLHGGYYVDDSGRLVKRARRDKAPPRLMPEEIYKLAGNDRALAQTMLRENGYITDLQLRRTILSRTQLAARLMDERMAAATTGMDAFRSVPKGLGPGGGLLPGQRAALREYKSAFFTAINGQLRRGNLSANVARTVGRLDDAMAVSQLRHATQVWRGVGHPDRLFGEALGGDMTGLTWQELAYTSTSTVERYARDFALRDVGTTPVLMRILAPARTGAVTVGFDQAEVLLQRGLKFRVAADRGISPDGYRLLDVEVVP